MLSLPLNKITENIKPLILPVWRPLKIKKKSGEKIIKQDHTNKQKQCNFQESTKTLNKSCSVGSMDIETDNIIANLSLTVLYLKNV